MAGNRDLVYLCCVLAVRASTVRLSVFLFFFNFQVLDSNSMQCHKIVSRPLCTGVERPMSGVSATSWLAVSAARDVGCFGEYCAEIEAAYSTWHMTNALS